MIKKYVGLDFLDLVIQFGITMGIGVVAATATRPQDEIGVGLVAAASLVVLAWRRARALRHQAPMTTGEVNLDRLNYLEERVGELEQGQNRIMELEERLDFTERMLAQQRDPAKIGPGQ